MVGNGNLHVRRYLRALVRLRSAKTVLTAKKDRASYLS